MDLSKHFRTKDFSHKYQSFGKKIGDPAFNATADLDSSGTIDIQDFLIFVQAFGN